MIIIIEFAALFSSSRQVIKFKRRKLQKICYINKPLINAEEGGKRKNDVGYNKDECYYFLSSSSFFCLTLINYKRVALHSCTRNLFSWCMRRITSQFTIIICKQTIISPAFYGVFIIINIAVQFEWLHLGDARNEESDPIFLRYCCIQSGVQQGSLANLFHYSWCHRW